MKEIIFDAEGAAAGRVASIAAKELLKGKTVFIINAEKAVVSGNPRFTIALFKGKVQRGDPSYGPFYPKAPERILKRMARGMMPYKKPAGKKAFKRLRVYVSVPEELQGKESRGFPRMSGEVKHITLEHLSKELRGA